jgi:hypothetical protein
MNAPTPALKNSIRIGVLVVHYAILAATALLVFVLNLLGGIDRPHAMTADEARFLMAIVLWGLLLYVPTAWFIATRKSAVLSSLAIVPPLGNLLLAGFFALKIATIATVDVGQTIAAPMVVGVQTIPAGSRVGRTPEGHFRVTLPAGATYANLPLAGPFEVDANGSFISGSEASISHDVSTRGVACSAKAPVVLGGDDLIGCNIVSGTAIDGVPCSPAARSGFGGAAGMRAQCEIARPYRFHGVAWPAGTRIDLISDRVTVGASAPREVAFRGGLLPPRSVLEFGPERVAVDVGGTNTQWFCQTVRTGDHCNQPVLSTQDFNIAGTRFAR